MTDYAGGGGVHAKWFANNQSSNNIPEPLDFKGVN
jgi:hypothetical protein